ncbi:hypothetical protein FRY74_12740 [Vicingus serpentipes]|uniref:Uncharacterized protein n=1 Tax=Vicingus serpentipes TaxID=1926625 RepID=A0A5C6RPZ2_9FLAO|nr:hypothetical protein [Vicingus serpentipes]TXB63442.1 hypothetical protein FRY74_12740 [Vicingus serpentipes]
MKKSLTIFLFLITLGVYSQENTYKIIKTNKVQNLADYSSAMNKASFDQYRFFDKRRVINFESGVQIELFSANELKKNGVKVEDSISIKGDLPKDYIEPVFRINENGHVIMINQILRKRNR